MAVEHLTDDQGFSKDIRGQNQMEGKDTTPSELIKPWDLSSRAYLEARVNKILATCRTLPQTYQNITKQENLKIYPPNGPWDGEITFSQPISDENGNETGEYQDILKISSNNLVNYWETKFGNVPPNPTGEWELANRPWSCKMDNATLEDYPEEEEEETEESSTSSSSSDSNIINGGTLPEVVVNGQMPSASSTASQAASSMGINSQEITSTAISAVGAGVLAVDTLKLLKEAGPDMIKEMVPELINEAVKVATERASQLAGEYAAHITKMTLQIPTEILRYSKIRFDWTEADAIAEDEEDAILKTTIGKELAKLGGPTEKKKEEKQKKMNENKTKKFIQDVAKKAPEMIKAANEFVKDAESKIELAMTYAVQGPEYVEQQMNNIIDEQMLKVDDSLKEIYKTVQKEVNKFCKNVGYWQGKQLIIVYNKTIELAAKALRYVQSKMTAQAQAKAKQAIQIAKLQIMSKIDIELPI
jgi:hypothetical protein